MKKIEIYKIIKITSGGMHAICDTNVGIIRKEIKNIKFYEPPKIDYIMADDALAPLRWYQKLWLFYLKPFIKKYVKNITNS